jgi:predicted ArsR family transcriptional regulator
MGEWTFITNHGAVLALVAEHGQITAREIAGRLNITERSVHRIITDLESAGYLERNRDGRANWYRVRHDQPLRRDIRRGVAVGDLLRVLTDNQFAWDWPQESSNV